MMICLDRDTGPVHPAVCSAAPSTGSRGLSLRVTTRIRMSPAVLRVHVSASRASARTVPQRLPTRKPHPLSQQSQKALGAHQVRELLTIFHDSVANVTEASGMLCSE